MFLSFCTFALFASPGERFQTAYWDHLWQYAKWEGVHRCQLLCKFWKYPKLAEKLLDRELQLIRLTKERAIELIGQLDSEDEKVWKASKAELRRLDLRLAMTVQEALPYCSTPLQARRLAMVLYYRTGETPGEEETGFEWNPKDFPRVGDDGVNLLIRTKKETFGFMLPNKFETSSQGGSDLPGNYSFWPGIFDYLETKRGPFEKKLVERLASGDGRSTLTVYAKHSLKRLEAPAPAAKPKPLDDAFWNELGGSPASHSETRRLLSDPKATVDFLRDRLKPIQLDLKTAEDLLANLFSDDAKVALKAYRELRPTDLRLAMTVEKAFAKADTAVQRARLVQTYFTRNFYGMEPSDRIDAEFDIFDFTYPPSKEGEKIRKFEARLLEGVVARPGSFENRQNDYRFAIANELDWSANRRWMREECLLWILHALDTPDAWKLIESMATGHPKVGATVLAKEMLKTKR